MATHVNLEVGQPTLLVHVTKRPDTVNDERIVLDWGLETLHAIPRQVLDDDPRPTIRSNKSVLSSSMH